MIKLNDAMLSLSLSFHKNKGSYALVLGSGISRAASIPTGWEIIVALMREIAVLNGKNKEDISEDSDLEAWYRTAFGEPTYSELLSKISKNSPAERSRALKSYFEPNTEDIGMKRKVPTLAHIIIAKLIKQGFIKVIITTNFDRLLESALRAEGIEPTVISSAHQIKGAEPLVHSQCTIIKVHGDYLSLDTKNITSELEKFDRKMVKLLKKIFDDFGLIVCGWSAEWDIALRSVMESVANRRFTIYWAAHNGVLARNAKELVNFKRCCEIIPIESADAFFQDLYNKVISLEEIAQEDPVNVQVAISTVKRFLPNELDQIRLHDFVCRERERVFEALKGQEFHLFFSDKSEPSIWLRIKRYEKLLEILLAILIEGCYWGNETHFSFWKSIIHRVGSKLQENSKIYGDEIWEKAALYPPLFLLYGGCISALSCKKYNTVTELMIGIKLRVSSRSKDEVSISTLSPVHVYDKSSWDPYAHNVVSQRLQEALRLPLKHYIPDDNHFEYYFNLFELILNLCFIFEKQKVGHTRHHIFYVSSSSLDLNRFKKEINELREAHFLVQCGLFDGKIENLIKAMEVLCPENEREKTF